jgi:hypothetical protein
MESLIEHPYDSNCWKDKCEMDWMGDPCMLKIGVESWEGAHL